MIPVCSLWWCLTSVPGYGASIELESLQAVMDLCGSSGFPVLYIPSSILTLKEHSHRCWLTLQYSAPPLVATRDMQISSEPCYRRTIESDLLPSSSPGPEWGDIGSGWQLRPPGSARPHDFVWQHRYLSLPWLP